MRKITHIEDLFIRSVILELNGKPVMVGTPWCKSRRALGGKHRNCPNFKICMVYWKCQYKLRVGLDIGESDFVVPVELPDFLKKERE